MVIQVKIREMKSVIGILGFIGIIGVLFSCSSTKKLAEPEQVQNIVDSTVIDTLSENKNAI